MKIESATSFVLVLKQAGVSLEQCNKYGDVHFKQYRIHHNGSTTLYPIPYLAGSRPVGFLLPFGEAFGDGLRVLPIRNGVRPDPCGVWLMVRK